jgi:hypothetical protein
MFIFSYAGVSRSATLVIAYLMRVNRWLYEQTFSFVKQSRGFICPNRGFRNKLLQLEIDLGLSPYGHYDSVFEKSERQTKKSQKEKMKGSEKKNKK